MIKIKTRQREVVYLGGSEKNFKGKAQQLAKRFKSILFTNVNLSIKNSERENYLGLNADFLEGLKTKKDESVDIIRSEMALGYFTLKNKKAIDMWDDAKLTNRDIIAYTTRVLKVAKKKLTKNGKIVIVAENSGDYGANAIDNIEKAAKLNKLKISFRRITKAEVKNSEFWVKHAHENKKMLFVIELRK